MDLPSIPPLTHLLGATAALATILLIHHNHTRPSRQTTIPPNTERVLILGASSGLGRALTLHYTSRGAHVYAVARRREPLQQLARECSCVPFEADITDAEAMARLREAILGDLGGLDTVIVCAGVSAVQPVLTLTGAKGPLEDPDVEGVRNVVRVVDAATRGNFVGAVVGVVSFLGVLKRTSKAPAVLHVSSLAAVVPAPTRAVYAATKAAALLFYQSLAIENPGVAFVNVLPATIEGRFRAGAVDAVEGEEGGEDEGQKKGMKVGYVVRKCVEVLDGGVRGSVVLPWWPYRIAQVLYWVWPGFVEGRARAKYNFEA